MTSGTENTSSTGQPAEQGQRAQPAQPEQLARSKQGQDRWVIDHVYHGKKNGWFIEAGAVNGIAGSNTYLLERAFGWTGVCVEPVPNFYEELRVNRKCHTFNCCLTDQPGEVTFTLNVTAPGTSAMADSLSDSLKDRFYNASAKTRTVSMPGRPLSDLLDEVNAPQFIEYFSLDVEGAEEKVLRPFPFHQRTFGCMTVERGAQHYTELRRMLAKHGYRHVRAAGMDDHFVHESVPYAIPLKDRIRIFVHPVGQVVKRLLKPGRK